MKSFKDYFGKGSDENYLDGFGWRDNGNGIYINDTHPFLAIKDGALYPIDPKHGFDSINKRSGFVSYGKVNSKAEYKKYIKSNDYKDYDKLRKSMYKDYKTWVKQR
jgi:hypothetical protein